MQFTVPQFIDIESKIIGPISVRQFVTLLVAGVLIYLDYQIFFSINFFLFAVIAVLLFGISGLFAFLRLNGRPFHYFLLNLFNTMKEPRLRVWSKSFTKSDFKYKEEKPRAPVIIPHKKPLSASKLTQVSLIVDTGGAYQEDELSEQNKK
ncbi:MAG: PrgI family protein [Patescibacteria group bacterium]